MPTTTPSPTPSVLGDVFLEDDFSDPSSGWPDLPPDRLFPGLTVGYKKGQYSMDAAPGAKLAYMLPAPVPTSANHVVVSVDVAQFGEHALYGLFCKSDRRTANAFLFVIDSTGSWSVARMNDGRLVPIEGGRSEVLQPGIGVNRLEAYCFDKEPLPNPVAELRFRVNGEELFAGRVPRGLSGPKNAIPGLYFETDIEGDTEVLFDDFLFQGVDPNQLPGSGSGESAD